jgi:UDP-N-acetylglucosamine 2-epimerase (non-hydrolysing)
VEAGLRTSDRWLPYPEEMNRRITGTIASYNFSPTSLAREHLIRENVNADDIIVTGNTVIDAFIATANRTDLPKPPRFDEIDSRRPLVVVTAHRRENHPYMREMFEGMLAITKLPGAPQIYFPVHLSPHVKPIANEVLGNQSGVVLVEPIDYAHMVAAVKASTFVLTDSGGLQEEAPCLGKPVLVMREETERPEGLEAGTLELVGHSKEKILGAATRLLGQPAEYARMARATNPYGDGHASERIVAWLLARLRGGDYPAPFGGDAPG